MKIIKNNRETLDVFVAMKWSSTKEVFEKEYVKLIFEANEIALFIHMIKQVFPNFKINQDLSEDVDLVWAIGSFLEKHYKEINKFDWRIGKVVKISPLNQDNLEILCECEKWIN